MAKPQVRLDPDLHRTVKSLIGYEGHRSVEDVVDKALRAYIRLNSNLIAKIDKRESKR